MGCYRYQNVSKISRQGLSSLLWDVPSSQHTQIITSLRNRFLIECYQGEYCLYSVISTEAISRLQTSEYCEIANYTAEYWTNNLRNCNF